MGLQKLSSTDAFVVVDLDGADTADGVVRWAKKVLVDGARNLARTRTYAHAVLGQQVSGASAGINAVPEDRAAAVTAFVEELTPQVASGALLLDPAKGVGADDLGPLLAADGRPDWLGRTQGAGTVTDHLFGVGVAASAAAAVGDLDGRTVVIEGAGAAGPALVEALAARGAKVVAVATASGCADTSGLDAAALVEAWSGAGEGLPGTLGSELPAAAALTIDADVLVCGSKVGLIDHEAAASVAARVVVPCGPLPVTARGLAVARRRDITVLPDFVTTAGPLLGFRPTDGAGEDTVAGEVTHRLGGIIAEVLEHPEGPVLGACYRAEEFLRTWRDELPFGRPLA
ncbi:MAG: hypothetical protein ACOYOP_05715 [Microthrixaceae bacterium]